MEDRVYVCVITGRNRETMFMQEIQVVYAMQRPYMQQRERERERIPTVFIFESVDIQNSKVGLVSKSTKNCVKKLRQAGSGRRQNAVNDNAFL